MKKLIVFGSRHWPDCIPAKEYLSEKGIEYIYFDISENMLNLKRFLKYRDDAPEFKEIKEGGRVGLPCFVINKGEQILFDFNLLDEDSLKDWWRKCGLCIESLIATDKLCLIWLENKKQIKYHIEFKIYSIWYICI